MLLTTESQAPMARRDQLAFVVFGTWMVLGLFVDGWAHNHQKPETFFTPWHAVLYSGFGAAVLWGVIDGRRRPWVPPAGQRLTNIGAVLFGVGAVADMVWHQVFGIEVNLAALLSPTHLLLMTGGILAASGPLRAAWATDGDPAPSLRAFFPTLVSLGLVVAVASFFAQYLSAFRLLLLAPSGQPAAAYVQIFQIVGIASVLATNLLLLVPVALVLRRWRPPAGTFTLLFGGVALLMTALDGFHHLPLVAAAAAGGLAADRFSKIGRAHV